VNKRQREKLVYFANQIQKFIEKKSAFKCINKTELRNF